MSLIASRSAKPEALAQRSGQARLAGRTNASKLNSVEQLNQLEQSAKMNIFVYHMVKNHEVGPFDFASVPRVGDLVTLNEELGTTFTVHAIEHQLQSNVPGKLLIYIQKCDDKPKQG